MSSVTSLFHFFDSDLVPSSSDFLVHPIKLKIWNITAIQNKSTKVALILFIEIAILSEDSPNHQFVHHVRENTKVRN